MSRRSSAVLDLQKIKKNTLYIYYNNSRFVCEFLLLSYELVSVINAFSDTFQQSYSDKQNYFLHNERKTVIIKVNYNLSGHNKITFAIKTSSYFTSKVTTFSVT